jgi:thioesterase domain-containing protein/acyl carrier protein/phenylacetate-coenzyme A ligase PaaK-like adenylate-forming protein
MSLIPECPHPTLAEFLRGIALSPEGEKRFPGQDLRKIVALAQRIARADPDPRRPYPVLIQGDATDFILVMATLVSGRPLLALDCKRDRQMIQGACAAANALVSGDLPPGEEHGAAMITPLPDDPAMIISTSGTTGSGKLWARSQHALMLQAVIQGSYLQAGAGLTFASLGHFQATAAINAIGLAMIGGANYQAIPLMDGEDEQILARLSRAAPAFISCTPTIFRAIARAAAGQIPWQLRGVWFHGERIRKSDLAIFHQVTRPGVILRAHYGSTESGNVAVGLLDELGDIQGSLIPSGKVSPVVELRIADQSGLPLPVGQEGRILVRSALLGKPVGHYPQDRYVQVSDGEPFFDLGDDGYLDSQGTLYVLGRRDGVTKIGGVRVDTAALEQELGVMAGVREIAAFGVQGISGGDVLVIAAHLDSDGTATQLRRLLRRKQGAESRAIVVNVGSFPRTANQKIDLGALRRQAQQRIRDIARRDPPATPAEHLVANCWAEVLGIDVPPRNASFAELGGDSLSFLHATLLIEQRFGLVLPDQQLENNRTVATQAAALQPRQSITGNTPVFSLAGEGQVVLACCAGIGGHAWSFGPLARAVSPGVEVLGVRWHEAPAWDLAKQIASLAKGRPVLPLGFSGGGRPAWLIAEQLLILGVAIPRVVILDGSTRQSIGKRHFWRAIKRLIRPRSPADRYLLALSYACRRWNLGKTLKQLPLDIDELRCPDRPGNYWGNPEQSLWSEFAMSVSAVDLDCEHQRIVKPPILPEVCNFVRRACALPENG